MGGRCRDLDLRLSEPGALTNGSPEQDEPMAGRHPLDEPVPPDRPNQSYVVHPIDDVRWIEDPGAIHELEMRVAGHVRAGDKVVVNCMSGLNRSGLLVGRALIALGYLPIEAVELIRRARGPHALSNREFVRFLLIECTPRKLAAS